MFYYLFVILIVIASLLMIGIVLIQESKGGGLSSNFSAANQLAGVRKTTDFIEKATWSLAGFMVVLSIACAYVAPKAISSGSVADGIEMPATNVPGFGASQTQDAAPAAEAPAETPAE